jgi:predicted HicB family RNase H-like nuclease
MPKKQAKPKQEVPEPSVEDVEVSGKFMLRIPPALHKTLAERAKKEGVSLNYLVGCMLSEEMGAVHERQRIARWLWDSTK